MQTPEKQFRSLGNLAKLTGRVQKNIYPALQPTMPTQTHGKKKKKTFRGQLCQLDSTRKKKNPAPSPNMQLTVANLETKPSFPPYHH